MPREILSSRVWKLASADENVDTNTKKTWVRVEQNLQNDMNAFVQSDKWAAAWQNKQSFLCTQWRLRSAWTSAQSDQSLLCPHEVTLGLSSPTERTAKTLIRLGGCQGWSNLRLGDMPYWLFYHVVAQVSSQQCALWVTNEPLASSCDRETCSYYVDASTDLSLRWTNMSLCGFCCGPASDSFRRYVL